MKKRDDKIDFLERFLEFCYADLEDLSMVEQVGWANELSVVLGFLPGEYYVSVLETGEGYKVHWDRVEATQREVLDNLNWLYDHLGGDFYLQVNIPYGFVQWKDKFALGDSHSCNEKVTINVFPDRGTYELEEIIESKIFHQSFAKVLEALDGLPASSLLRCSHCGKIFFNPTRRRRIYCSQRCQNTAGVERHREKKGG